MGRVTLLPRLLLLTHHHVISGCKRCVSADDRLITCSGHVSHNVSCLRSQRNAMTAHVTVFLKDMTAQHEGFLSGLQTAPDHVKIANKPIHGLLPLHNKQLNMQASRVQLIFGFLCYMMLMHCICTPKHLRMQV